MEDHWPWEAKELNPWNLLMRLLFPKHRKDICLLKTSIIRNYCVSHPKGQFSTSVGYLTCLGQKFYNDTTQDTQWWGAPNHTEPQPHPLAIFSNLQRAWNNFTTNIDWQAPKGLHWICGKKAYTVLPSSWFGSFVVAQSYHLSSCFPSDKVKNWESPYLKKD
jgi:hypothetical protein